MRKFKEYLLTDCNGNLLAKGRYNEVMRVEHSRYVYRHIFDDCLYFTGNYIDKNGNVIK